MPTWSDRTRPRPRVLRSVIKAALLAALLPSTAGCAVTVLPRDDAYEGPTPVPPAVKARFAYEEWPAPARVETVARRGRWDLRRVRLWVRDAWWGPRPVVVDWYRTRVATEPAPLLLVLPILGGDYVLSRHLASWFAARGYHTAIVHRGGENLPDELDAPGVERAIRRGVVNHRRALDWLLDRPEVDAPRTGAFGVSLGAIGGTVLAAVEPRVRRLALVMGGGDLPRILSVSIEPLVDDYREARLETRDDDLAAWREALEGAIVSDPVELAPHVDARTTLMVVTTRDRHVPTARQLELRDAIGGPRTILVPCGHYQLFLFVAPLQRAVLAFFDEAFRPAGRAARPRGQGGFPGSPE